jgi:hypothetical protein
VKSRKFEEKFWVTAFQDKRDVQYYGQRGRSQGPLVSLCYRAESINLLNMVDASARQRDEHGGFQFYAKSGREA